MKTISSRPFLSSCIALMSAIFISACGDDNSSSATDSPIESSSSIEYIEPTINSSADSDSVESSSRQHTISSESSVPSNVSESYSSANESFSSAIESSSSIGTSSSTTIVSSSSIESSNSNEVTSSSTKKDTVVESSSSKVEDKSSSSINDKKEESSSSMEKKNVSSSSEKVTVSSSSEKNVESSSSSELIVSSSSEKKVESSSSSKIVESSSSEKIVNSSSSDNDDYIDENEPKSTEPHYVELDELKLNGFRVENNIAYLSWENNTNYTMQINVTYRIGCNLVGVADSTIMYTIKANSVKEKAIYEIKNNAETCRGEIKNITATENDKSNFVGWKWGSDRGVERIQFYN
ncbi:hypothetical protein [Fibrobacter sp. UWH4]|uniref:hypothetical protein n=1 Tax=Fibrobacter sp. UWH4 TaxID=1896210 RepID=UPI0009211C71|nr:hypothetical protein [Fibrobacter sp. UWH4]SHK49930.1 hypothetical protein SAMN05720762_10211 [Fibrobacter sp. UWH4]